jgi:hypothetical protein
MLLSADMMRRKVLVALLGSRTYNGLKRRRSHFADEAAYDDIVIDDQFSGCEAIGRRVERGDHQVEFASLKKV